MSFMNELLFFAGIIVSFCLALSFYKLLGRIGLLTWISMIVVVANIEVVKCVDIFTMPVTLGNALYCSISLATDILNEKYGIKEAKKSVWLGFLSLITFVVLSQIALLFTPNELDFASESLKTVFATTPRICMASLSCFLFSNLLDTYVFAWLKKKCRFLWVRINVSTLISQFIDSMLFSVIAFSFVLSLKETLVLGVTTYIVKVIITVCNTPFVYLSKNIKPIND